MAENVTIKVDIDVEEAQAKLQELYDTQKKLVEEMASVDEGSEAYKELGNALEETNKQIGSIESNINKQTIGIDELDDVTKAASTTVTHLGLAETTLGKVINTVAGVVGKMKSTTKDYTKAQQAANMAVNNGTKAVNGMNKALKSNILITVVALALPLIASIVDKIKELGKETLTLEDRIDRVNARYERVKSTISKLGAGEIVELSVEQRRLNEEIALTRAEYVNMMNAGKEVTEKMWKDLEALTDKYEDNQRQIKYLNEDLAETNKLLEEQANLDRDAALNTRSINTAKARLEIEKEKNGYSEEYFQIQKNIFNLEEKDRDLKEQSLQNQKDALDRELSTYVRRVNEAKGLTAEEKKQSIANKEKSIEIERQKIDNQQITINMERQLASLQRQKSTLMEVRTLEEQNIRLMIQMQDSTSRVYAANVRNQSDMADIWRNQNDQMKLLSQGMVEWRTDMMRVTGEKTVDEFLQKWGELTDAVKSLPKDVEKWDKSQQELFEKYQRYSSLSSRYASTLNQLITDLESNIGTTVEAQTKAVDSMYQFFVAGAQDATEKQFQAFKDNLDNIKVLYDVLVNEYNEVKSDTGLMGKFTDLLNTQEGFADLYVTFSAAGLQGIKQLEGYMDTLKERYVEVYNDVNQYTLDSMKATTDYFAAAMMVGLGSYRDYLESYEDYLYNQAEISKLNLDQQVDQMRMAGVDEVDIARWVAEEKLKIDDDYNLRRRQLYQNANLEMLSQGTSFVNNMMSVFSDLYSDNKDMQKATIVVNTLANAAMAFGSTFAQAAGGLAAKAAQAAAASAAVVASGIKAYRQVDSANKNTTLSGAGSSTSVATGTSSVSSTILERQIRPQVAASQSETVLVLTDVEYKQRQNAEVRRVSVI